MTSLACGSCGLPSVAGADRCLRCGGQLVRRRRPASPFKGDGADRRRLRPAAVALTAMAVAVGVAVIWSATSQPRSAPGPAQARKHAVPLISHGPLPATHAPSARLIVHLQAPDVQESCVGRPLPGDREVVGGPVAVIDDNPLSSWHCDGDGARRRPPQSLAIFFPRALTLTGVGVIGFDPYRPCRFVTLMALVAGSVSYQLPLPASVYRQLRWFAVPSVRADKVSLVVLRTVVPPGRQGPNCARTAVAQISFAAGG